MPLHVFEPRYRALIADALGGLRVFTVPQLAPGWHPEYHGAPDVLPVAGAGFVEAHRKLDDDRYFILVRGVMRVRIDRELDEGTPYRVVRASELDDADAPADDDVPPDAITVVRAMLAQLSTQTGEPGAEALAEICRREDDVRAIVDMVGAGLLTDSDERQSFLECLDVTTRLERVSQRLAQLLRATGDDDVAAN